MLASPLPAAWWAATVCLMATVALGQTPTNGAPAVSQCYSRSGGCKECIEGGTQTDNCGWCPSDLSNKCRPGTVLGASSAFSTCYDNGGSPTTASGGPSAGGWAFYKNQCSIITSTSKTAIITAAVIGGIVCLCGGYFCYYRMQQYNEARERSKMTGIVISGPALSENAPIPYGRETAIEGVDVWEEHTDPAGRKYYYNPQSEMTSWKKPVKVRRV